MMFKNTLKLVAANFSAFWKLFLYKVIVLAITVGLTMVMLPNLEVAVVTSGFDGAVLNFLNVFAVLPVPSLFVESLLTLFTTFLNVFAVLFSLCLADGIGLLLILFIVFPFLNSLSSLAYCECVYGYMASLSKFSFVRAYISKLGKSSVYSILKTLIVAAFSFAIAFGFYGIAKLSELGGLIVNFVPVLLAVFGLVTISLVQTFLSGWAPAIVVFNDGATKGFYQGLKAVGRRFLKVFSSMIVINFMFMMTVYIFGVYSLIAFIPLYTYICLSFQMVMFFGSQGMRYYVDQDTILTPQKLETYDKYNKIIDLL